MGRIDMKWEERLQITEKILERFPRLDFSSLPTPLRKLERISEKFGIEVYCKRDDLTGLAFGGNKVRKLEFLMAEARAAGADAVIAVGAVQSNFCRVASAAASVCGMDSFLVLGGEESGKVSGNFLLDRLLGAEIRRVQTEDWVAWEDESAAWEAELRAKGRIVYRMPLGGSTPIGSLGYLSGFCEILNDASEIDIKVDAIACASSSGGTLAGLAAGKALTGWPGRLIGFGVAGTEGEVRRKALSLAKTAGLLAGLRSLPENLAEIDNSYMGAEYGARTEESAAAIELFARTEGIFLDRVYSGKAAAGLLDYLAKGSIGRSGSVVFIHTGGAVELFS